MNKNYGKSSLHQRKKIKEKQEARFEKKSPTINKQKNLEKKQDFNVRIPSFFFYHSLSNNKIRIKAIKKERWGRINRFGIIRMELCLQKRMNGIRIAFQDQEKKST